MPTIKDVSIIDSNKSEGRSGQVRARADDLQSERYAARRTSPFIGARSARASSSMPAGTRTIT